MSRLFATWLESVHPDVCADTLWRVEAYRLALFAADGAFSDAQLVRQHRDTRVLADQLLSSSSSIGAHIAEGYGRWYPRDRARFYEYGLGSVRESRHWYWCARHTPAVDASARIDDLTHIGRLLTTMVQRTRRGT